MSTFINYSERIEDVDNLHFMPCYINFSGDANVTNYFLSTGNDAGILSSSFRGRPLLGKQLDLPKQFKGFILKKNSNSNFNEENRIITATQTFNSFTYWNLDLQPSANDTISTAFDWLNISEALHASEPSNKTPLTNDDDTENKE